MTIYNNQVFEDMDLYHLWEAFIKLTSIIFRRTYFL